MKSNQTVLVTGAGGALGETVVSRFLAEGCRVIAADHALELSGSIGADPSRPNLSKVSLDLGDASQVKTVLGLFKQDKTTIDALVHCAGGFRWAYIDETADEDFEFLINANIRSVFNLLKALLPEMKARKRGRMIFVGANAALHPSAGLGAYSATKSALHVLVQSAAAEVKGLDININAVLPGIIDTPANRKDMPDADRTQWVSRESLADIIFSLAQPWGSSIHGALIPVTGRM